jgi:hypothetical protein
MKKIAILSFNKTNLNMNNKTVQYCINLVNCKNVNTDTEKNAIL